MAYEYVYLLTNPAMPEWVKVGKTNSIPDRLRNLSDRTAVPLPFECQAALKVPADKVFDVEHSLHEFLGFSLDSSKEFFRTKPDTVLTFFRAVQRLVTDCTLLLKEDLNAETPSEKKKAAATTFEILDLPVGSKLVYTGDSTKVCEVADAKNHVVFEGQNYSLSDLAFRLCGYRVSGYQRFTFDDELLADRRQRLHPEL
jgi:hypothetical protein